ncbi:MAG TPA: response regulator transcription factor [Verrucomicrobiota bacterium]|nr:response regulator transcription factor [Verrucomicrobiota bacterium]HNU51357.1 response regulator transcription factor [Verrucomicrobiota bacterium]
MKILIVDDNPEIRQLLRSLFDGMDAECIESVDGQAALTACREQQPDWVLMDIEMPVMDGLTATRQITQAFPGARVLILTQYEGPHLRAAAIQAGATGYLLKDDLFQARAFIEAHTQSPAAALATTRPLSAG